MTTSKIALVTFALLLSTGASFAQASFGDPDLDRAIGNVRRYMDATHPKNGRFDPYAAEFPSQGLPRGRPPPSSRDHPLTDRYGAHCAYDGVPVDCR
jgi:hypothetical protein